MQLPKNNAAHHEFLYLFIIFSHPFSSIFKKMYQSASNSPKNKDAFVLRQSKAYGAIGRERD